jgi:hydroxyacylglutathione hydrolase
LSDQEPPLIIESREVGPFRCNAYLIGCPRTKKGLIIDPGDEAEVLLERARELGLSIEALVHTHTHLDHVGATRRIAEELAAPILIHPADIPLYRLLKEQRKLFGFPEGDDPRDADRLIEDQEEIRSGDLGFQVIHTPGHTPGSICLRLGDRLFSGDTLFRGSIGRTDLGGTSTGELVRSIKERLYPLGDHTDVLPGHGPPTTLGQEKRTNPFLT